MEVEEVLLKVLKHHFYGQMEAVAEVEHEPNCHFVSPAHLEEVEEAAV